jgi:Flp pilus assembly protein TadG
MKKTQGQTGIVRDSRGQTLVEFAFASFVFFATIFGMIEFGRGVWQYNMMSDLAQEGARWAAVRGATASTLGRVGNTEVSAYVTSRSRFSGIVVTTTPSPVGAPGTPVSVQVSTTFQPLTRLIPSSAIPLSSTATMIVHR